MPKKSTSFFEDLIELPWWVSVIFAACVYIGLHDVMPGYYPDKPPFNILAQAAANKSGFIAFIFLLPAPISIFKSWRRGELFTSQTSLASIRNLSWRDFEEVVAEAYRNKGYTVEVNSSAGADGGVDVLATKDGETTLIQCKHWKARKVGVQTVREMFGLLNAERGNEVHIVISGYFTKDAKEFAVGKPIKLIGANDLWRFLYAGIPVKESSIKTPPATQNKVTVCPSCGSEMVKRMAKRGKKTGSMFWGCSTFPACRGTRSA